MRARHRWLGSCRDRHAALRRGAQSRLACPLRRVSLRSCWPHGPICRCQKPLHGPCSSEFFRLPGPAVDQVDQEGLKLRRPQFGSPHGPAETPGRHWAEAARCGVDLCCDFPWCWQSALLHLTPWESSVTKGASKLHTSYGFASWGHRGVAGRLGWGGDCGTRPEAAALSRLFVGWGSAGAQRPGPGAGHGCHPVACGNRRGFFDVFHRP